MIIVAHASDWSAIQCNPIAQQSALIVTMRPAQRSTMARLATSPGKVNQCQGDRTTMSRQPQRAVPTSEQTRHYLRQDKLSPGHGKSAGIVAMFPTENLS